MAPFTLILWLQVRRKNNFSTTRATKARNEKWPMAHTTVSARELLVAARKYMAFKRLKRPRNADALNNTNQRAMQIARTYTRTGAAIRRCHLPAGVLCQLKGARTHTHSYMSSKRLRRHSPQSTKN